MKYTEAVEYMESLNSYGIVPGLSNIENLCDALGNPQKDLKFVHIAGTNGKGSVLAYISTVLKCAGYKVGRYVSPTIFEYRERIQVNGRTISQKALCAWAERIKEVCDGLVTAGKKHPTSFEAETALAFAYFKEQGCDIVVMECGMGGRLDATNVIENTLVSVLASISMDHMQYLGKTLEAIAAEKAGIIKAGCRVVTAMQEENVLQVIQKKADEKGCPVTMADLAEVKKIRYGLEKQRFDYGVWKNLEITLSGKHQIGNALLAIKVLEELKGLGYNITEKALRNGLKETKWPGRFTVVGKKPYFIVDGAHNPQGAQALMEAMEALFPGKKLRVVVGVLADKDYHASIAIAEGQTEKFYAVSPPSYRALEAEALAEEIRQQGSVPVAAFDSIPEAIEAALAEAGREDVICIFGSLYQVGDVRRYFGRDTF